jgi:integrase
MSRLVPIHRFQALPSIVWAAGEKAQLRFLEFFAASIRNVPTRRAYAGAVGEFLAWCEGRGVVSIAAVQPLHVAAYIEALSKARSAPTAKLRLAAIRRLFDWLVIGQVMAHNPASSVRGPSHVVKRGKTPVLAPDEARHLLDSIDATMPVGLRDRALIGLMVFSFARIGAAVGMKVEDVYAQHRRLWLRPRRRFQGRAVPDDRPRNGPAHPQSAAASQRPRHDPPARGRRAAPGEGGRRGATRRRLKSRGARPRTSDPHRQLDRSRG